MLAGGNPLMPQMGWFDPTRIWFFSLLVILCGSVLAYIFAARRGMQMKVRRIAGLAAVDDAVGRATEMGRPILYVPGIQDMNDIQTIASLTIPPGSRKRLPNTMPARVEVPTTRSLVMTAARETVQAAYLAAGRPEAFRPIRSTTSPTSSSGTSPMCRGSWCASGRPRVSTWARSSPSR